MIRLPILPLLLTGCSGEPYPDAVALWSVGWLVASMVIMVCTSAAVRRAK